MYRWVLDIISTILRSFTTSARGKRHSKRTEGSGHLLYVYVSSRDQSRGQTCEQLANEERGILDTHDWLQPADT